MDRTGPRAAAAATTATRLRHAPWSNRQSRRCRLRQHRRTDRDPTRHREGNRRASVRRPHLHRPSWPLADVRLLAPILASKVVCIGKNYAAHAAEMGGEPPEDPVIFLKPNTAIIGPNVPIQLPAEAHPGALRGRARRRHRHGHARTCPPPGPPRTSSATPSPTMSRRAISRRQDGQWTRAKGYDTFCPIGPVDRHRRSTRPISNPHRSQRRSQAAQPHRR